ncbi:hypothetical protein F4801DRAFT_430495 [Xylaria longipes]|nr:hypothetical protein F4801DRAFT_430495 [Xylaria longipes]
MASISQAIFYQSALKRGYYRQHPCLLAAFRSRLDGWVEHGSVQDSSHGTFWHACNSLLLLLLLLVLVLLLPTFFILGEWIACGCMFACLVGRCSAFELVVAWEVFVLVSRLVDWVVLSGCMVYALVFDVTVYGAWVGLGWVELGLDGVSNEARNWITSFFIFLPSSSCSLPMCHV